MMQPDILADVEVVATYEHFNINRTKLEKILHKALSALQIDLTIRDRFGCLVNSQEWFLVSIEKLNALISDILNNKIGG